MMILMMDDDYLSLFGVARLCISNVNLPEGEVVTQLTLSMYLLVQSKLRLRHSMMSLT